MKERFRRSLITIYRVLDVASLAASLWLAFLIGAPVGADYLVAALIAPTVESTLFFSGVFSSWIVILSSFWLYRSKRLASWEQEFFDVVRSVIFSTLVLATMILLAEWPVFPKRFLLIFAGASIALLSLIRFLKRRILRNFRLHGRNLRSVVVVGAGTRGEKIVELIEKHPEIGYEFIGFVDDLDRPGILGKISEISKVLSENVIDEIIICLPIRTYYDETVSVTRAAEVQGVTVRVYSDLLDLKLARAEPGEIGTEPILSIYSNQPTEMQSMVKATIDFFGALMLLAILWPVMAAIAIAIKLTSPGPALFVQERVGFNKRRFRMFKFRTMSVDASDRQADLEDLNEAAGPVFKIRDDPRVTPLGRWLRRTSLDELPQLFNVLLGDLSLVGPRPLPERDFRRFEEVWFNRRFSVKPGITCIWQISGRSDTSFDNWIMQDLEYVDKWSLLLDLKILVKTIPSVLRGTGAM